MTAINIQMYSFNEGWDKPYDNEANFKAAAEMGYDGVELFGPNLKMDPAELKGLLKDLNLNALSLHAPSSKEVEDFISLAKTLEMKFIGIGMETLHNDDEVHAFAERLNKLGAICKKEGLTLTYHNHTQEFAPCGSTTIFDTLMAETNPEDVAFELDAGWAAAAGENPIDLIKKYSGRIQLIHLKESDLVIGPQPPMDFSEFPKDEKGAPVIPKEILANMDRNKRLNCAAGKGLVDWAALRTVADANGCVGYTVERETTPDGYESRQAVLKADIEYYKSIM